jgi:hypothetical protein
VLKEISTPNKEHNTQTLNDSKGLDAAMKQNIREKTTQTNIVF